MKSLNLPALLGGLFLTSLVLGRPTLNGFPVGTLQSPTTTTLDRTMEWQYFYFSDPGTPAMVNYLIDVKDNSLLDVVDLYCRGDQFQVVDEISRKAWKSSPVEEESCHGRILDPNIALRHPKWSKLTIPLAPGTYSILIVPYKAPFTAGQGAIRVRGRDVPLEKVVYEFHPAS